MIKGDKCWIVENGSRITQAEILSFSGNLCLIRLALGGALRVPRHRLYESEEDALKDAQKTRPRNRNPYDHMQEIMS